MINTRFLSLLLAIGATGAEAQAQSFKLTPSGYFSNQGVDVMAFDDIYPEGHQGGLCILMHGHRVATNGDIRLEADWSYIPGGVISGTALIRPDYPELLTFPFLWQQTEYVLGGGSSHYMFLVLAAKQLLNNNQ